VEQTYANWGGDFRRAARRHGLPVSWLVAIASVETGPWAGEPEKQATIRSYAGAIGVMQIMPATANLLGFAAEEMVDPAKNIDAGAKLIADLSARGGGLPAVTGRYNSGKLCCSDPRCGADCSNPFGLCTDSDYPGAAVAYNNTGVALGLNSAGGGIMVGLGVAAAGLYVAAVLAGAVRAPKKLSALIPAMR
jgi:soluble lytic murein transglycosylase-like protein